MDGTKVGIISEEAETGSRGSSRAAEPGRTELGTGIAQLVARGNGPVCPVLGQEFWASSGSSECG